VKSSSVISAYSEEQTERLTGISRAQLRYWHETDFYRPSYSENRPIAYNRVYSFRDLIALRVLDVLRNRYGISLQHLRDVRAKLGALDDNPDRWIETRLYPLNGRVIWYEEAGGKLPPEVQRTLNPSEVASGQYVAYVELNDVVQKVREAIGNLRVSRDSKFIGAIQKSRYVMRNAPVIAGTRIPVKAIKRFSDAGYSMTQILAEYPDLTEQDVTAALKYDEDSSTAA
jgi:uncharacterized protein (DUF433 family)/DNA-binding transcriptional MerR regulator